MYADQIRYITPRGGPPNGGRAPGMSTRYLGYSMFPEAPPPYTSPQPSFFSQPLSVAPTPFLGFMPQPHPLPCPYPLILSPMGLTTQPAPPPDSALPPPVQPVTPSPEPEDLEGAKLDGAKITFDDGITGYIFPEKHVTVHLMRNEHQPWDNPGAVFTFTVHKVPCMMPIKELIRRVGAPGSSDNERGIVECINQGNGRWLKGSVFKHGEDESKQRMEEVGWNESRGTSREPLWLAVYKA